MWVVPQKEYVDVIASNQIQEDGT